MVTLKLKLAVVILRVLSSIPFFSLSGLKSRIYRAFGAKVGEHVFFAPGAFIFVSDLTRLKIGDGVEFGRNVKITCETLEIGDDTRVGWGATASGTILKIGQSCYIAPQVYIDLTEAVIIEDDVGIGADYIFTHSIWHPVTEGGPRKFAPVHIERGAWIPAGVFIMPGVTIGENATVGARSLVINDVPPGCLAVGIPAKVIKTAEGNIRKLSHKDKDTIVRNIVDEYLQQVKKHLMIFSQNQYSEVGFQVFMLKSREKDKPFARNKSWALVYKKDTINEEQSNYLQTFLKNLDLVLFVSLVSIPAKIVETLNDDSFSKLVWFSIEDKSRKKSWDKQAMSLHNFFRSHYGIRFKFYGAKSV